MARLGLRAWPHSRECKAFHPEGTDQPWPPGGGGSPASSPVSWMPEAGRGLGPAGFTCPPSLSTSERKDLDPKRKNKPSSPALRLVGVSA